VLRLGSSVRMNPNPNVGSNRSRNEGKMRRRTTPAKNAIAAILTISCRRHRNAGRVRGWNLGYPISCVVHSRGRRVCGVDGSRKDEVWSDWRIARTYGGKLKMCFDWGYMRARSSGRGSAWVSSWGPRMHTAGRKRRRQGSSLRAYLAPDKVAS
jgi:hypothetical protein